MLGAFGAVVAFVTISVNFLYATRIAWSCGKKCDFKANPEDKKPLLKASVPAAAAIYSVGYIIIFNYVFDGFITILVFAVISAIITANLVVAMAMPELKFKRRDYVEKVDPEEKTEDEDDTSSFLR